MKHAEAAEALSALGHPGRLAIFRMLVKAGPKGIPAGQIARKLETPPNSLSANLNILSGVGLIEAQRDGRFVLYSACYERMSGLLGFLMEDCCGGAPQICAPLVKIASRAKACC